MIDRRQFLKTTCAAGGGLWSLTDQVGDSTVESVGNLHLARFRFEVTPPIGHPLCGGWITPVQGVDDSLEAIGLVVLGAGDPIVICAVDWTGLANEAYRAWVETLARAAGTTPERVAVQTVHQHDAPMACLEAERLIAAQGDLPHLVDVDFFHRCLEQAEISVTESVERARPLTHIAHGQSRVHEVASNRRVHRDASGRILGMRGSSCRNPELVALPEGLIDPFLKTVAFYDGDTKMAACHYYATHPMSHYGKGRVSSDFAGLARKRRQAEEPDCHRLYFTGCSGNIAAGKYNDGQPATRTLLTRRVYEAMVQSELALRPEPIGHLTWRQTGLRPPVRQSLVASELEAMVGDRTRSVVQRNRPACMLSWVLRAATRQPVPLSSLQLNEVVLLHLPAECFVQYQLEAQNRAPGSFVAAAAYGDGGPWYLPTKEEYAYGGYEVDVAFCEPSIDEILTVGIGQLLGQ